MSDCSLLAATVAVAYAAAAAAPTSAAVAVAVAVLVVVLDISVCLSFGCCCSSCQSTLLVSALLFVLCLFLFSSLKNFVNLITLRVS